MISVASLPRLGRAVPPRAALTRSAARTFSGKKGAGGGGKKEKEPVCLGKNPKASDQQLIPPTPRPNPAVTWQRQEKLERCGQLKG